MKITEKLLGYLNRVFDKDPSQFIALRLGYDGGLVWRVENAFLYTTVSGGSGQDLAIDLSQYTVAGLVNFLSVQPGYSVLYADGTDLAALSARVLIDGTNDIANSNGDHLYGYTKVLWAFFESVGSELMAAKAAIENMLLQMSTRTASDIWLDELGGYYGIPRLAGELDSSYGPRIIAEVIRPRENNVAMEMAIEVFTGQQTTVVNVIDYSVVAPLYDGSILHDGSHFYNSTAVARYGLFDVQYGYDLINGGSFSAFQQVITDLIDRLRAAGTHLRALSLVGSQLTDTYTSPPSDDGGLAATVSAALADTLTAPGDSSTAAVTMFMADALDAPLDGLDLLIGYSTKYNGVRLHNGIALHNSGEVVEETP